MNDELLTTLVDYFEDFEEQSRTARKLSEQDRDYADHKQWTANQEAALRRRKQPKTINNRIRKKVNFLRGLERQSRTDPKAFPRTPGHEQDADAVTDSLRFVADNTSLDKVRSAFFDNYLVEGTGGAEVTINKKKEIELKHVQWDRLFWDYHSRNLDFSDARYKGIIVWMDMDEAKARYKGKTNVLDLSLSGALDDTYEDKPVKWSDSKRKRVRIAQIYFKHNGIWHLSHFTRSGFLEAPTPSPWMDDEGIPECGIIMQSAYVDRDGHRFGEPRFMIEQQDAVNKRESKMLHLVNQRQTYGNQRAFPEGARKAKTEIAKPDGHVEVNAGAKFGEDWGTIPTGDMAAGQFTLLQEAKAELDQTSVNASLTGSDERALSGRAILAQQSGGQMEITPLMDGKREWENRVYRQFWNRIKQFWTEERWIRVTDDEKNIKFVGLNRTVTVGEQIEQEMGSIPEQFQNDPRLEMPAQPLQVENKVSEMDIDIIVEDAPDTVTVQQEQFEVVARLAEAYGPQNVPFEEVLKLSSLRNKDAFVERTQGNEEQQAQAQAEQQKQQVLQMEAFTANIEKIAAEAFDKQMSGLKKQAEAEQIQNQPATA